MSGIHSKDITHENIIIKNIDYGTEEYIKQVLNSSEKLTILNPFIGTIKYPSKSFLQDNVVYKKTVQFQNSVYVGYMDMLLPDLYVSNTEKISYSLLEFKLDGLPRRFLQISNPDIETIEGLKFQDYVMSLYPDANHQVPFNRQGMHILSDITISGAEYVMAGGYFQAVTSGSGSYTPSLEFEFSISGYKAILQ